MNGRVSMYNASKGYGFIIGNDKETYFFHISEVVSDELPEINSIVEFEKSSNEKGKCAKMINVTKQIKSIKNEVIVLGNVRIRVSNIKNYGITQKEFPYEKLFIRKKVIKDKWYKKLLYSDYTYEWCGDAIYCDKDRYNDLKAVNKRDQHTEYPWRASWDGICSTYIKYTDGDGIICESDTILTSDKIDDDPPYINKKIDCLYITTYQGDNFVFRSDICGFDILKGLDEIDRTFL